MDKRRRVPGRSAPYGQACLSCFKSKCKCIVRSDGGEGCERCRRLNKSCHSGDSLRQRTTNKAQKANARIAELEGKLGGLVSLLQERKVIDDTATPSPRRRSLSGQPDRRPVEIVDDWDDLQHETEDIDFCDAGDDGVDELQRPATGSPLLQGGRAASLTSHAEEPTADLEANRFDGFRSQQLLNFPFIHFSADVTALQLQVERPTLHRAIVCVTSPSAREKQAIAIELKHLLSDAAISQPSSGKVTTDDRMDLLLAILVFISWGWDHVLTRTSPSRLMMLAMSLAGEINLSRSLSSRNPNIFDPKAVDRNINPLGKMTVDGLLELQRALLGCFVLSSVVAAHFGEIDPLRWTPELDEALASIEARKQCPADATLAAQARLQLLAVDAAQARDQNHAHQIRAAMSMDPAMLQVKGMLLQLQDIRNAMSPMALPKYHSLQAHTQHTELCVLEAGSLANSPSAPCAGPANPLPSDHVSCLWKAELAVNRLATTLLALPTSEYLGASFIQWTHWALLARCVSILQNLAKSSHNPGSDPAALRALEELPRQLDRLADRFDEASAAAEETEQDEVFKQLSREMRAFRLDLGSTEGASRLGSGLKETDGLPLRGSGSWVPFGELD